jgi:hypothetical protein
VYAGTFAQHAHERIKADAHASAAIEERAMPTEFAASATARWKAFHPPAGD